VNNQSDKEDSNLEKQKLGLVTSVSGTKNNKHSVIWSSNVFTNYKNPNEFEHIIMHSYA